MGAAVAKKQPTGRPREWDREAIINDICDKISMSDLSLLKICGDDRTKYPTALTVLKWINEEPEGFGRQYACAKELQAEYMEGTILEVIKNAGTLVINPKTNMPIMYKGEPVFEVTSEAVNLARLEVDARKWLMAHLKPKKYGDRTTLAGDPDNPLIPATKVSMTDAQLESFLKKK
jgi:hypothetical protein